MNRPIYDQDPSAAISEQLRAIHDVALRPSPERLPELPESGYYQDGGIAHVTRATSLEDTSIIRPFRPGEVELRVFDLHVQDPSTGRRTVEPAIDVFSSSGSRTYRESELDDSARAHIAEAEQQLSELGDGITTFVDITGARHHDPRDGEDHPVGLKIQYNRDGGSRITVTLPHVRARGKSVSSTSSHRGKVNLNPQPSYLEFATDSDGNLSLTRHHMSAPKGMWGGWTAMSGTHSPFPPNEVAEAYEAFGFGAADLATILRESAGATRAHSAAL